MVKILQEPVFKKISEDTLGIIRKLNREQNSSFLIPTRFISAENAQLAYLLNAYYNCKKESPVNLYRSFFVNSSYEAFSGAVKLIRHYGRQCLKTKRDLVMVYGEESKLAVYVNPLGLEEKDEFLIRRVEFNSNLCQIEECIETSEDLLAVIIMNTKNSPDRFKCTEMIRRCRDKKIITILDETKGDVREERLIHQIDAMPDLIIMGEELTDYEVPFAVFSMREEIQKPWTSLPTCLLHSSTYAGNKLAVTKALTTLLNKGAFVSADKEVKGKVYTIGEHLGKVLDAYKKYINPGMVKLYSLIGYDFICEKAHGSWLEIRDQKGLKKVIDGVSGGGASPRGHTPDDIIPDVLDSYSEGVDYWKSLQQKFQELLSFEHAFPSVSGATAVENAYVLALLAGMGRKKIVIFKNNYAGKTLIALNGTDEKESLKYFSPLYKNVIYIDPFDKNAKEVLLKELKSGEVALMWFEMIQGGTLDEIPEDLLDIIQSNKKEFGYFVGVDEILMGFYRVDKLTSYHGTKIVPDLVTISKALTDSTFPIGVTLVCEEVYRKAMTKNSILVTSLETAYVHQFGACLALNSINKISQPEFIQHVRKVSEILQSGIKEIEKGSNVLSRIAGKGHIYQFYFFKDDIMKTFYFCRKAIKKEDVFIFLDRLAPALTLSEEDAKEMLRRLRRVFSENPVGFKFKYFIHLCRALKRIIF